MPYHFLPRELFDSTSPINSPHFFSWLTAMQRMHASIKHYTPIKMHSPNSSEHIEVSFTHPMIAFEKPERTSTTSKKLKPKETMIAVYEPEPIGMGSYGAVHQVLGVWKKKGDEWIYKTKDPLKTRLIKTNFIIPPPEYDNTVVNDSYISEYTLGKFVPHMGYRYKPFSHKNASFLLMRQQFERPLEDLILELKDKPNLISATDRLKITRNLLIEMEKQVHAIHPSDKDPDAYLVHRDIKPLNIMIASDLSIHFIDYGLATLNTANLEPGGTKLFMDPQLLLNKKNGHNRTTDLASLGRVIAELWGDKSNFKKQNDEQLDKRNINNEVVDLFVGISGLSDEEKETLQDVIIKLFHFDVTKRITREQALLAVDALLNKRLADEETQSLTLAKKPIVKLNKANLLSVLKGSHADLMMNQLAASADDRAYFIATLEDDLLNLDQKTLIKLKSIGVCYTERQLTIELIKQHNFSATHIAMLIQLGVPLAENLFKDWCNSPVQVEKELRWAEICRVLMNSTNGASSILNSLEENDSFQSFYLHHVMNNQQAYCNDKVNIRLVKRHFELLANHNQIVSKIRKELTGALTNTPLAQQVIRIVDNAPLPNLLLYPLPHLQQILEELKALKKNIQELDNLKHVQWNTLERKNSMTYCNNLLQRTLQLKNRTLVQVLNQNHLTSQIQRIAAVDLALLNIRRKYPRSRFRQLYQDILDAYQDLTINMDMLIFDLDNLYAKYFRPIDLFREQMDELEYSFPKNASIEAHYLLLRKQMSVNSLSAMTSSLEELVELYSIASQRFKKINSICTNPNTLHYRKSLYGRLHIFLWGHLEQINRQGTNHALTIMSEFQIEEIELQETLSHYRISENFIYAIFNKVFTPPTINNIQQLTRIMERINKYALLSFPIIMQIERFHVLKSQSTEKEKLESVNSAIEEILWTYLSEEHIAPQEQEKLALADISACIDSLKPQSAYRNNFVMYGGPKTSDDSVSSGSDLVNNALPSP